MYVVASWSPNDTGWSPNGTVWFLESYIHGSLIWTRSIENAMKVGFHRATAIVEQYDISTHCSIIRVDDILKGNVIRIDNVL